MTDLQECISRVQMEDRFTISEELCNQIDRPALAQLFAKILKDVTELVVN